MSVTWIDDRRITAMGSTAHIVVQSGPRGLIDWAEAEVHRLEGLWSRFRPTSDLSRLNDRAGRGPVEVHPMTFLAIERSVELAALTDGLFDPTVLASLEALGYDRTFRELGDDDRGRPDHVAPAPTVHGIVLDPTELTVTLPAGTRIDLGGIGKGLAGDIIAEGLIDRGAKGAAIGLGGDVRIAGVGPDNGRWDIDVENPLDDGSRLFTWPLVEGGQAAIVTSTTLMRTWTHDGRRVHHLVDPRSGRSTDTELAAVVVAASDAWLAEGIAKAAVVAGRELGTALALRTGVSAWLIELDGTMTEVRR